MGEGEREKGRRRDMDMYIKGESHKTRPCPHVHCIHVHTLYINVYAEIFPGIKLIFCYAIAHSLI